MYEIISLKATTIKKAIGMISFIFMLSSFWCTESNGKCPEGEQDCYGKKEPCCDCYNECVEACIGDTPEGCYKKCSGKASSWNLCKIWTCWSNIRPDPRDVCKGADTSK